MIATEPAAMMGGRTRTTTAFETPAVAARSGVFGGVVGAEEAWSKTLDEGFEGWKRAADYGQVQLECAFTKIINCTRFSWN